MSTVGPTVPAGDARRRVILLVEDEALIAMDEARRLAAYNYEVMIASSGEQAIRMVCRRECAVDLVLMDINLGEWNGRHRGGDRSFMIAAIFPCSSCHPTPNPKSSTGRKR